MNNNKKLLIICDSHGTNWGCNGYADQLKNRLATQWDITTLAYPGISINKIYDFLRAENVDNFDAIVLGVGNPDVHPRIPRTIIIKLKSIGISSARDSYFSVPPQINASYIARLPLFLFRLIAIRFKTETYTSTPELTLAISSTLKLLAPRTKKVYILPIFKVNSRIYGHTHNTNADIINNYIKTKHATHLIEDPDISENVYKKFRNYDFFHFKDEFQAKICAAIEKKIQS